MHLCSRRAIGAVSIVCTLVSFMPRDSFAQETPPGSKASIEAELAPAAPVSGNALTLEEAVSTGRSNSPIIQRAQAVRREAEWQRKESLSGFLPSLTLSGQHFLAKKYQFTDITFGGSPVSIPGIFPTSSATLSASLPLFDGLRNVRQYSAGRLRESAASRDAHWTEFRVEQDVRLRFLQALAAERLLVVARQNVSTIEDHLKQVQSLRRGGVATNYDVLRTEVQVSEALSERLQAEDNVYLARQRLAVAMGLERDVRPLQGDLPDPLPLVDHVRSLNIGEGLSDRADLIAQENRVEAAKKSQQAAEAYWVPKISLAAQYIYYNNLTDDLTDIDHYRNAYNLGVVLTWNLFDGFASFSRAEQAESQWYQAERAHRQALLQAPVEFDSWKRRFLSSATVYTARRADIEKAQESVRLAREGFRAGTRTSTEVLDAELELFRARAGVVNAQMSSSEALINLELAIGRRL